VCEWDCMASSPVCSLRGREQFACGPDVRRHLGVAQPFVDAGFDRLALMNAGPDPDGFLDFFTRELAEPLRKLTPAS